MSPVLFCFLNDVSVGELALSMMLGCLLSLIVSFLLFGYIKFVILDVII